MNFTTSFEAQIRRNDTVAHAAQTRLGRLARQARKAATAATARPVAVQVDSFPVPVQRPATIAA